ncbi:transposase [Catenuloplanes atrovinosus]|uniref:Transposase n=1 Tax=Catenuloplanes atrovinosus TaxID=137266 RepID=A0AAE3YRP1_9ACTN|nr:transposase [Catenuloplanes atrovinosus]
MCRGDVSASAGRGGALSQRRGYLSDAQWALIEPLLPEPSVGGRPEKHPGREIVIGTLYVVRSGCCLRIHRRGRRCTGTSPHGKRPVSPRSSWPCRWPKPGCGPAGSRNPRRGSSTRSQSKAPTPSAPTAAAMRRARKIYGRKRFIVTDALGLRRRARRPRGELAGSRRHEAGLARPLCGDADPACLRRSRLRRKLVDWAETLSRVSRSARNAVTSPFQRGALALAGSRQLMPGSPAESEQNREGRPPWAWPEPAHGLRHRRRLTPVPSAGAGGAGLSTTRCPASGVVPSRRSRGRGSAGGPAAPGVSAPVSRTRRPRRGKRRPGR